MTRTLWQKSSMYVPLIRRHRQQIELGPTAQRLKAFWTLTTDEDDERRQLRENYAAMHSDLVPLIYRLS
jgi:hypothetical protein